MKTSRTVASSLLVSHKLGRVTACAPQFNNAGTARRGLTSPTIPRSWSALLFVVAALATVILQLLSPISAHAQGGVPLWTNVSSGGSYGLAVDGSGNVFVTGDSGIIKYSGAGTPLWTNQPGPDHTMDLIVVDKNGNAFATDSDVRLLAYSSTGTPLWTNGFARFSTALHALAVDNGGNVFVAGEFDLARVTIKYSSAGVPLWTNLYKELGNNYISASTAIAVDSNGDVFVTGISTPLTGTTYYYVTIKYSNEGVPLWTNRYNGGFHWGGNAMAMDSSGNVFVTAIPASSVDYATIKYSSSGVPLWTNRYDGPAHDWDIAGAIAVDASGNVFVTGRASMMVWDATSGYLTDYATIKYSNSGVPLWTNYYDGPAGNSDYARAIAVDSAGNVFVAGYSVDVPCCPSSLAYATVAYSNTGELLWENRLETPVAGSIAPKIAVDPAGDVIVSYFGGGGSSSHSTTIKYSSSLPPPVQLDFQKLNNQLLLSWTNAGFTLQTAPFVTGPFTNLPAATSPYTNLLIAPRQFFRLIGN